MLEHSWQAAGRGRSPLLGLRSPPAAPGGRFGRDAVGLLGTAIVHALLFLVIVLQMFGNSEPRAKQPGSALKLMDLTAPAAISETKDEPTQKPAAAAASPPPPPPTPPKIAEWSERRIVVSSSSTAIADGVAGPPAAGVAQSSGGGGGYDPYAGAAPLRSFDSGAARSAGGDTPNKISSAADLTTSLASRIVAIARSRWPTMHGSATFAATIDRQGRIASWRWKSGTLSRIAIDDLKALLAEAHLDLAGLPQGVVIVGPITF